MSVYVRGKAVCGLLVCQGRRTGTFSLKIILFYYYEHNACWWLKNVKIAEKYGEGYLTLSYHPEKVSAHTLLYFLLVYFFPPLHIFLSMLFLMVLKGVLPGKGVKKCHSPLWDMSRASSSLRRMVSGGNISRSFWKREVMWFLPESPVEGGGLLGTEQSVEYSDFMIPEEENILPGGCWGPGPGRGTSLTDQFSQELPDCLQWWVLGP